MSGDPGNTIHSAERKPHGMAPGVQGCSGDLRVRDNVGGRWWKKCPLLLSCTSQALLSGEHGVFIFASDGFAKTQWHAALTWATQLDGGVPRTVETLYDAFCSSVRATSSVAHLLPSVRPLGRGAHRSDHRQFP